MKIVRLQAENIKRLKAVDIRPAGPLVEITGKNGQGKSSVLDSIWWALTGARNIQTVPIRKGAERAIIRLDLGEIVVERRFNEKGTTVIVESAEGARFPSPQAMLDKLVGSIAFDPLEFTRMAARDQYDTLRRIAKIEVDFDTLRGLNERDAEKRRDLKRDAAAAKARADGILVPDGLPDQPIDATPILDRLAAVGAVNAAIKEEQHRRENLWHSLVGHRDRATESRQSAAGSRRQAEKEDRDAEAHDKEAVRLEAEIAGLPPIEPPADAAAIRAELAAAEKIKSGIDQRDQRQAFEQRTAALLGEAEELTTAMVAREKTATDAVKAAAMPVAGLGFGPDSVTLGGLPFDQASAAEQLRVSLAIAMAANPTLRVIRIMDGSLLDDDGVKWLASFAAETDYQVWIERVDSSGKVGITIEDGGVAAIEGVEQPAAAPKLL